MTKTCTASAFETDSCECLTNPTGILTVALGVVILLGNVVFLFQVAKIKRLKSTVGISVWMVALHCWFNTFFMVNYVALSYYQLVPCCVKNNGWFCFCSLLAVLSQAVIVFCVHLILATFVYYHSPTTDLSSYKLRIIWISATSVETAVIALLAFLAYKFGIYSSQVQGYGFAMAVVGCGVVALQWVPQIYTSTNLGRVGSLSVLMTTAQAIGGVAATLNAALHSTTAVAWIAAAFNTFMIAVLMLVLFRIWFRQKRGISFMFSFMMSPERRAELEQEILEEIAEEEQEDARILADKAPSDPCGNVNGLIEGQRSSSVCMDATDSPLCHDEV